MNRFNNALERVVPENVPNDWTLAYVVEAKRVRNEASLVQLLESIEKREFGCRSVQRLIGTRTWNSAVCAENLMVNTWSMREHTSTV